MFGSFVNEPHPVVERARPLLGTHVSVRVHGLPEAEAHRAIDDAFAAIALIHARMSFHEPGSDVSRLNANAFDRAVEVHPHTYEVLHLARELSEGSDGCFDITVAPQLVDWGLLPLPPSTFLPDPAGNWRDVELRASRQVRFRRALWIDLGGIAKGYAVDRAIERLQAHGAPQACVNAGGDLRVYGPATERIALRCDVASDMVPAIEIKNGSLASSAGAPAGRPRRSAIKGPHVDGRSRRPVDRWNFVCVAVEQCVIADALTKVVLARGRRSEKQLQSYGATAHLHVPKRGWRSVGSNAWVAA